MSCTVTISPLTQEIEGGSTGSLLAMALDCPPGGTFSWNSSDTGVATVTGKGPPDDYQGTVQPMAGGTASITVTYVGAPATAGVTVIARNFIVVFGDAGKGVHNLGKLPELAAKTHEREIRANTAPDVPKFSAIDTITTEHVSRVSDLVRLLGAGNIVYLTYFGHSWNENGALGALFIGQDHAADTNLTEGKGPPDQIQTCTSPATLPATAFRPNASIRLFGCRGAFGTNSAAEQIARSLKRPVFGFDNSGGSIFTNDVRLGHGQRAATAADMSASVAAGKAVWMVPSDGTPHFRQFGP
jgi:hypothetical protein